MFKVMVLLALLSPSSPAPPVQTQTPKQIYTLPKHEAEMCYRFKDGVDCQEAYADTTGEVCWCAVIDHEWLYCGCMEPRNMSEQEYFEYLVYLGMDNEDEI